MQHNIRLPEGEYGIPDLVSWLRKCTQDSEFQCRSDLRRKQSLLVTTPRGKLGASDAVTSHNIKDLFSRFCDSLTGGCPFSEQTKGSCRLSTRLMKCSRSQGLEHSPSA